MVFFCFGVTVYYGYNAKKMCLEEREDTGGQTQDRDTDRHGGRQRKKRTQDKGEREVERESQRYTREEEVKARERR